MPSTTSRPFPIAFADPPSAPRIGRRPIVLRMFDALSRWQDWARQRHQLAGLDDHLLKDIGLSRADAARESAKPFWRA